MPKPDAQPGISRISFAKYVRHLVDINWPAHKLEGGLEVGLQHSVLHGTSSSLLTMYNEKDRLNHIHGLLSFPSSPSDWQRISCWHNAEKNWGFGVFYLGFFCLFVSLFWPTEFMARSVPWSVSPCRSMNITVSTKGMSGSREKGTQRTLPVTLSRRFFKSYARLKQWLNHSIKQSAFTQANFPLSKDHLS